MFNGGKNIVFKSMFEKVNGGRPQSVAKSGDWMLGVNAFGEFC